MRTYRVSKTTVWHHIRNIALPVEAERLLRGSGGRSRGERGWQRARARAKKILEEVDWKTAWIPVITSLYWSEGTKRSGFVFTNTDEDMVRIFTRIVREKFGVGEDEFDVLIRTCEPMSPEACRRHWSAVVGLPPERITINHNNQQNKSKTQYGICRITLRKGSGHLKIMHCLIKGMADKMLERSDAPVAQGIEPRTPNAVIQVRLLAGAPDSVDKAHSGDSNRVPSSGK